MNKTKEIIDGWKNFAFKSDAIEEMAKRRAKICGECPFAVKAKFMQRIGNEPIKEVIGMKCDLCGCPLSAKTRSPESNCPAKKWLSQANPT